MEYWTDKEQKANHQLHTYSISNTAYHLTLLLDAIPGLNLNLVNPFVDTALLLHNLAIVSWRIFPVVTKKRATNRAHWNVAN